MASVVVTNNYGSTVELPAPLTGSLGSQLSKTFNGIPLHHLEASKDLQDARNRGLLTLVITDDADVSDDMEEGSVAAATGGSAAAVAAHATLATGVHGVGGSTIESAAGSAAKVTAHNIASGVHGVVGSTIASAADIVSAIGGHSGAATGVHGVGGSTVASATDVGTAVSGHVSALHYTDPAPAVTGTYTTGAVTPGDLASFTVDVHGRITAVTLVP